MSAISDLLAKRQAAAATPTSTIQTGMQGSVPVDPLALVNAHLKEHTNPPIAPEAALAQNAPEGAYLFIRLQQLICKGGRVVKPDAHGFYVPKNADEESRLARLEALNEDWCKKIGLEKEEGK